LIIIAINALEAKEASIGEASDRFTIATRELPRQ
jgi:hypothetical protein